LRQIDDKDDQQQQQARFKITFADFQGRLLVES
jgi:hypothetical protein